MKLLGKYLPLALFITTLGFVVWFILIHPTVPDTWTHMGLGKYILLNRSLPFHQDISYKDVGWSFAFLTHSWLGDSLIYMATVTGESFGAITLLLPTLFGSLFILWRIFKLLEIKDEVRYVSLSLAALIALTFWRLHPLTLVTPIMLFVHYLHLEWRLKKTKSFYILPLVFVLCANISGGFTLLTVLFVITLTILEIVLMIVAKLTRNRGLSPTNNLLSWIGVVIASILAVGINPLGYTLIIYGVIVSYLIQPLNIVANIINILNITSQSYAKNSPSILLYTIYTSYFIFTCAAFIFLTFRTKKLYLKKTLPLLPLLVPFVLPFFWIRLIPLATFVSLPFFASLLQIISTRFDKSPIRLLYPLFLLLSIMGVIYLFFNKPRVINFDPPVNQIKFIKESDLPKNLMTSPDLTGYTFFNLFPDRAMLDLQDDIFDENSSIQTFAVAESIQKKIFDDIFQKNNVNTLLLNKDYGNFAVNINQNPEWSLVYFDDNGYVFVRNSAVPTKTLDSLALRHIDLGRNLGFEPKDATASAKELERFTKKNKSRMALGQLATIYRLTNNLSKAEKALNEIPKNRWDFTVFTEMGRVKAGQGLCKAAEFNLLKAISNRGEQNFSRAILDLAVVYAGCLKDVKKATHYFKRYNSFVMPPFEHARVQKIADDFGININEY